jgi:hypothetical protein
VALAPPLIGVIRVIRAEIKNPYFLLTLLEGLHSAKKYSKSKMTRLTRIIRINPCDAGTSAVPGRI